MTSLREWNIVVSVRENHYSQTKALLKQLGAVSKTPYFNVLVMWVPDIKETMEQLRQLYQSQPEINDWISHFVPVTAVFHFSTAEEFEEKAKSAVLALSERLAGGRFHVRMQRRGFKDRIESSHEEQMLGELILDRLEQTGKPGRIVFDDPDAILVIETVGQQAGLAAWTREDLMRFPFLHLN